MTHSNKGVFLIILGEQHTFSEEELIFLKKIFFTIDFIKYNSINPKEVINTIIPSLQTRSEKLIVLNTKASIPDELLVYFTKLEKKNIQYISIETFIEKYLNKCYIPSTLTNITFLEKIKPLNKKEKCIKFLIDYSITIPLLLLTSPIMLFTIYKIKKESPGSIIFTQKRIGLNGKEFTCYKFRSMHENSHHDLYTRENDTRVYPWGNFMRKTRIDELPQLINVLKGDMHLIGPRAEWNKLVEQYEIEIPYYHQRHLIKPGITGWAQVNYPYGTNIYDTKQKLMYDLYYIKSWSILLEIKTIWKTIEVIFAKRGL